MKDATTYRTPRNDTVGMGQKAGASPQLPGNPKKRKFEAEARQNEQDLSLIKAPEDPATTTHSNSEVWVSWKLKDGRTRLTKRAVRNHNRLNSYSQPRSLGNSELHIGSSLKRFARVGGPDLRDLRGFPEPLSNKLPRAKSGQVRTSVMPPKRRASEASTAETASKQSRPSSQSLSKASTAYTANFGILLKTANVQPPTFDQHPANLKVWMDAIEKNSSPLGSEAEISIAYKQFQQKCETASLEDEVMSDVFPAIRGEVRYPRAQNRICSNLADLTDDKLTIPKPDYMEGCEQTITNGRLREALSPFIVFADVEEAPFSSNFFTEVKGDSGGLDVAKRQARYDGALGARAIHMMLNLGKDTDVFDGKAYTVTFTYYMGFLQMYLHFIVLTDHPLYAKAYKMAKAGSWALDSLKGFREGVTAFRNAQDLAHDLREEVVRQALATVNQMSDDEYQALVDEATQLKLKTRQGRQRPAINTTSAANTGADANGDLEEPLSAATSPASLNSRRQQDQAIASPAKAPSSKVPEKQGESRRGSKVVSRIKSHLPKLDDSQRRSNRKG